MQIKDSIKTLFQKAKDKDEFNFVCTLIDYKGMGSVKYLSNLPEWFDAIEYYESIFRNEDDKHKKLRIGLLIYSTFFESIDLYNLLGNLARNILGYRGAPYLYWKHDKADRWLGTGEKVSLVTEILTDAEVEEIAEFFNETHIKQIRNTFFHSSYSLEEDEYILQGSEPVYISNVDTSNFSITNFLFPKIERVLEFFHAFKDEYVNQFNSYTTDVDTKGKFPIEMDIKILGSENGLYGFVTPGSYIKKENDFWTAMNIVFDSPDETRRFILDELKRFIAKEKIRSYDGSLQHLYEVITERNRTDEKQDLGTVFQRFGDIVNKMAADEDNSFKERDLSKRALSYYQKMLNIDDTRIVTNDIACLKYSVGIDSGNNELVKESLNDFLECIEKEPKLNPIENGLIVFNKLKNDGIDIESEKTKLIELLSKIDIAELEEIKVQSLAELEK